MDNKRYQDELEDFLQDEIKDHRMYPSDQIWRNIQHEVHGPQTWPALTFISLFIISALTVATLINNHPAQKMGKLVMLKNLNNKKATPIDQPVEHPAFNPISTEQVTATTIAQIEQQQIADDANALKTEAPIIPMQFSNTDLVTAISTKNLKEMQLPTKPSFVFESNQQHPIAERASTENASVIVDQNEPTETAAIATINKANTNESDAANSIVKAQLVQKQEASAADEYLKEFSYKPVTTVSAKIASLDSGSLLPLLLVTVSSQIQKQKKFWVRLRFLLQWD